jgi:hypothetical protein
LELLRSAYGIPGARTEFDAAAFNSRITENILRVGVNYKFDAIWAYD